jgi:hypothetical protein
MGLPPTRILQESARPDGVVVLDGFDLRPHRGSIARAVVTDPVVLLAHGKAGVAADSWWCPRRDVHRTARAALAHSVLTVGS